MGNCFGCFGGDESDVEEYYYPSGYGGGGGGQRGANRPKEDVTTRYGGQGGANLPLRKQDDTIRYDGDGRQGANRPLHNEGVTIMHGGDGGANRLRPYGDFTVTYPLVGYKALVHDLDMFKYTNKAPSNIGNYVSGDKATQIILQFDCYSKLLKAWKEARPPPTSDEAFVVLIKQTLQGYHNIEGLLRFYGLPCPAVPTTRPPEPTTQPTTRPPEPTTRPNTRPAAPTTRPATPTTRPAAPTTRPTAPTTRPTVPTTSRTAPTTRPAAPITPTYTIHTLPVDERRVGDGDGFYVYVDVNKDAREREILPDDIKDAVEERRIARSQRDFVTADALQDQIKNAHYKVVNGKKGCAPRLLHEYEIRLRGVDAPEMSQPYGEEAKAALRELVKGQELLIHVYNTDPHGREVGDVYCDDVFIQEVLLKKGAVWWYEHYDKRQTLAKWEKEAKDACRGLWMAANPEAPWHYKRRTNPEAPWRTKRKSNRKTKGNKKSKRNQSFTKAAA